MPWLVPERTLSAPTLQAASRHQSSLPMAASPNTSLTASPGSLPRLEGSGMLPAREPLCRLEHSKSAPLLPTMSAGSPDAARIGTASAKANRVVADGALRKTAQVQDKKTSVPKL